MSLMIIVNWMGGRDASLGQPINNANVQFLDASWVFELRVLFENCLYFCCFTLNAFLPEILLPREVVVLLPFWLCCINYKRCTSPVTNLWAWNLPFTLNSFLSNVQRGRRIIWSGFLLSRTSEVSTSWTVYRMIIASCDMSQLSCLLHSIEFN